MAVKKRSYLKQSDVPRTSLDEALRVPKAILEQYAGEATTPFNVAKAIDLDPKGSQMKVITGSAIAFGLTEGGAQSSSISITELAKTILRPLDEGADLAARKEAILKPRIFGEFLNKYDTHTFPRDDIARNVLISMGVPDDQAEDVRRRIEESAQSMGFIETIKGKKYIHLNSIAPETEKTSVSNDENVDSEAYENGAEYIDFEQTAEQSRKSKSDDGRSRKVFITHGKNKAFIEPIKKLLGFGEMIPVVSVEKQSVSKPVPIRLWMI
ncbi:hypothetical protein [Aliikangiella sp. IMCC44359]|uniref:hypothetical protein n=1 Tax=Aliikangiella sp. IMCC44359 TaxID=3459125 RepID=UPI00403ABD5D